MKHLICLALLLACVAAACDSPPVGTVVGKWQEQGGAVWEFSADGKVSIKGDAKPAYSILGEEMLRIDFNNFQSLSITYKYELSERKLILTPEEAGGEGALPQDWDEPTVLVRAE